MYDVEEMGLDEFVLSSERKTTDSRCRVANNAHFSTIYNCVCFDSRKHCIDIATIIDNPDHTLSFTTLSIYIDSMHYGWKHHHKLLPSFIYSILSLFIFSQQKTMALHHGRSLSLPSSSHPATSHFDENLSRLRSSEAACSSLSSINATMNGLKSLYESIDDLLLLPHIQEIVSEECVDDCISLLDACSSVKDIISLAKQDLRQLLSAVRRKDGQGINAYLSSRKRSKKMIQKCLKNLRRSATSENVSMLKDAESVAISFLESLLSYVLGMKMQERKSSWSLVSKLMPSKKASDNENEFNKVESFLQLNQENELVSHLKEMDSSIQVIEEELESIFRKLIKTRVSLLNILNN